MTAVLVMVCSVRPRTRAKSTAGRGVRLAMGYVCFSDGDHGVRRRPDEGQHRRRRSKAPGLSPLLQHPAMMIHPPIVFAGYAAWTLPVRAGDGRAHHAADSTWNGSTLRDRGRFITWVLLGSGILLGANWAYEELGWGGYWGWDPVENGSLMPWLTGTVFIHSLMVWRHRDG